MLPAQVFLRRRTGAPIGPLAVVALEVLYASELIDAETPVSEDGEAFLRLAEFGALFDRVQEAARALSEGSPPWQPDAVIALRSQGPKLSEGSLLRRMALIATHKLSGVLSVEGGLSLCFSGGALTEVRGGDPFSSYLRDNSAVDPAALTEGQDLAALVGGLMASQALPPDELFAALQAWAIASVAGALDAPEAGLSFAAAEQPKPVLPLGLDRLSLPIEVARAGWSDRALKKHFSRQGRRPVIPTQVDGVELEQLKLRPAELRVVRQIDGLASLEQLLEKVGGAEEARRLSVLRVLRFLLSIGFCVLGEDPSIREEEAEVQALTRLQAEWAERTDFELLGVPEDASDDDVQRAYKQLAKRYHPDTLPSTASAAHRAVRQELFNRVGEVFSRLRDAEGRARVAASLASGFKTEEEERAEVERILQAEADFKMGESMLSARKYDQALECFSRAAKVADPGELELPVYIHYTEYLREARAGGDAEPAARRALQVALDALKQQPQLQSAQLFAARLYKAVGEPEASVRAFRALLEVDPKNIEAIRELRLYNSRRAKRRR